MRDWKSILRKVAPKGKSWVIAGMADAMPRCIEIANLNTELRLAHFIAQVAHESDGFATMEEYASGAAYEGRDDLGNTHPGDGVRFKGRGPIQNTGRENYEIVMAELRALGIVVDLIKHPELLEKFPYGALASALFWKRKRINRYADKDDNVMVTKRVNGGRNGLSSRAAYLKSTKRALGMIKPTLDPQEAVNADDLRKAGSRIVMGADQVKNNLPGAAASALGAGAVATKAIDQISDTMGTVSDVTDKVQSVHEAAQAVPTWWEWLVTHREVIAFSVAGILFALCIYLTWRVMHGAERIVQAKVDDSNDPLEDVELLEQE